jgi:hypothetical protein
MNLKACVEISLVYAHQGAAPYNLRNESNAFRGIEGQRPETFLIWRSKKNQNSAHITQPIVTI